MNSNFIGTFADTTYADSSHILGSDLTFGIFTNSFYNNVVFTGSKLDYARFDSVYAFGSDFCLITKVGTNFDSLKVSSKTLCNPNEIDTTALLKK